ncbi:hypothetical protein HDU83_003182 [Entophlyctis luteolus]|nr:hypothetical protein HDU83_003182 [Entophlyctis luteolus]
MALSPHSWLLSHADSVDPAAAEPANAVFPTVLADPTVHVASPLLANGGWFEPSRQHLPPSTTLSAAYSGSKPPPKKPGRKPALDAPATRQIAASREKQRAFRERRANYVKSLEAQITELQAKVAGRTHTPTVVSPAASQLEQENRQLRALNASLQTEVSSLRALNLALRAENFALHRTASPVDWQKLLATPQTSPSYTHFLAIAPPPALPQQPPMPETRMDFVAGTVNVPESCGCWDPNFAIPSQLLPLRNLRAKWKLQAGVLEPILASMLTEVEELPSLANHVYLVDQLVDKFETLSLNASRVQSHSDIGSVFHGSPGFQAEFFSLVDEIMKVASPDDSKRFLQILRMTRVRFLKYLRNKLDPAPS